MPLIDDLVNFHDNPQATDKPWIEGVRAVVAKSFRGNNSDVLAPQQDTEKNIFHYILRGGEPGGLFAVFKSSSHDPHSEQKQSDKESLLKRPRPHRFPHFSLLGWHKHKTEEKAEDNSTSMIDYQLEEQLPSVLSFLLIPKTIINDEQLFTLLKAKQKEDGNTPLHCFLTSFHHKDDPFLIKYLLDRIAKFDTAKKQELAGIKNSHGKTIFHCVNDIRTPENPHANPLGDAFGKDFTKNTLSGINEIHDLLNGIMGLLYTLHINHKPGEMHDQYTHIAKHFNMLLKNLLDNNYDGIQPLANTRHHGTITHYNAEILKLSELVANPNFKPTFEGSIICFKNELIDRLKATEEEIHKRRKLEEVNKEALASYRKQHPETIQTDEVTLLSSPQHEVETSAAVITDIMVGIVPQSKQSPPSLRQ